MATIKELDAYFAGSPSYDLYKKLYGSGSSNAGNINQLYNNQLAQSQQYYDAQVKKLEGQRAQQAQALAADNMRAGRNIMQQTVQGGLANSGVQAQARVLNNIAGQRAQSDLASRYATAIGDLELDRAQKAYGIENNRYTALLNDREDALNRQATYAGILSGYEQRMANEEAAAAQAAQTAAYQAEAARNAALNADALVYRDTADLEAYYNGIADANSETAQNIINNYGYEAYNNYVSAVQKKLSTAKTNDYNALETSVGNMSGADAAAYYDSLIDLENADTQSLINSIGQANYGKLVKKAKEAAKEYKNNEVKEYIRGYLSGNAARANEILDYYNHVYIPKTTGILPGPAQEEKNVVNALKELVKVGYEDFAFITAAELDLMLRAAGANDTGDITPKRTYDTGGYTTVDADWYNYLRSLGQNP